MLSPMPCEAPVTSATLPAKRSRTGARAGGEAQCGAEASDGALEGAAADICRGAERRCATARAGSKTREHDACFHQLGKGFVEDLSQQACLLGRWLHF